MEPSVKEPIKYQSISLTLTLSLAWLLCLWPNWYLAVTTSIIIISSILIQVIRTGSTPSLILVSYLTIFMGSAAAGVWTAYAYPQALTKFLILSVSALLAIYISQMQGLEALIPKLLAIGSVIFSAAFLIILFLNINQGELLTPNRLAGLIGILTPFLVLAYLNTNSKFKKYLYLGAGLIVALALISSGSRGGLVALVIGLGFWKILVSQKVSAKKLNIAIITTSLTSLLIVGTVGLFFSQQLAESVFSIVPSSGSRLTLYTNLQDLLPDYWLLGGGLNSFSGHYSQYVLSIPHLRFTYGHHLYLDLILEQGVVGFISFCLLIASCFIFLLSTNSRIQNEARHFNGAILASLTVLVLHGFIDNAIYSNAGSTMLFIAPALALSVQADNQTTRLIRTVNLASLCILIGLAITFNSRIISAWHSNIGSAEMAKIELANWPTGEWSKGESAGWLENIAPAFERSLEYNKENASAEYRLGLIAMEKRDFPAAIPHLAKAHALNQTHIGIKKNLGYSLLWSGDIDQAEAMLKDLEGIHNELEAYRWWWQKSGRPDLSKIALEAHQHGIALDNK